MDVLRRRLLAAGLGCALLALAGAGAAADPAGKHYKILVAGMT